MHFDTVVDTDALTWTITLDSPTVAGDPLDAVFNRQASYNLVIEDAPPECGSVFPPEGCEMYPIIETIDEEQGIRVVDTSLDWVPGAVTDLVLPIGSGGKTEWVEVGVLEVNVAAVEFYLDGVLMDSEAGLPGWLHHRVMIRGVCGGTSENPTCGIDVRGQQTHASWSWSAEDVLGTPGAPSLRANFDINPIPEPSTAILMGLGLVGLAVRRGD